MVYKVNLTAKGASFIPDSNINIRSSPSCSKFNATWRRENRLLVEIYNASKNWILNSFYPSVSIDNVYHTRDQGFCTNHSLMGLSKQYFFLKFKILTLSGHAQEIGWVVFQHVGHILSTKNIWQIFNQQYKAGPPRHEKDPYYPSKNQYCMLYHVISILGEWHISISRVEYMHLLNGFKYLNVKKSFNGSDLFVYLLLNPAEAPKGYFTVRKRFWYLKLLSEQLLSKTIIHHMRWNRQTHRTLSVFHVFNWNSIDLLKYNTMSTSYLFFHLV